jgi:transposase
MLGGELLKRPSTTSDTQCRNCALTRVCCQECLLLDSTIVWLRMDCLRVNVTGKRNRDLADLILSSVSQRATIALTGKQRSELEAITQSRSLPMAYVTRAKLILLLNEGVPYSEICQRIETSKPTILRWKKRFLRYGLDGLSTSHPGQKPSKLTPSLRARVLAVTRREPPDGSMQWSCRKLAATLGISKDLVHRIWKEAGVRPHRLERHIAGNNPDFETKAADIVGLYLHPPQHAAVFRLNDKAAIQALDRPDLILPLSPARAVGHGFEYYGHGTLSLFAALDTKSGKSQSKTLERHTSQEFAGFLSQIVEQCPSGQEIHIILNNLSAHNAKLIQAFLEDHPNVQLHFTPSYSAWLNRIEIWFARIEQEMISRVIFRSVSDLAHKLRRNIQVYSAHAKPFRWKYNDSFRPQR